MKMSANNLKANLSNPARTYLWDVIIPDVIGTGTDTETLMLRCQSAALPARGVGDIEVKYKQTGGIRFPGRLNYSHDWQCTFIEGEDRQVFDAFYAWAQKIVHDSEGVGIGDTAIKSDIILSLVNSKGEEYSNIKLVGCYVKNVGEVSLSYNEDGTVIFPVTFSFDYWESSPV